MNHPPVFMPHSFLFNPWFEVAQTNPIATKPIPRWPDRRSYRAHQRDAAKRRANKGGAR